MKSDQNDYKNARQRFDQLDDLTWMCISTVPNVTPKQNFKGTFSNEILNLDTNTTDLGYRPWLKITDFTNKSLPINTSYK